MARKKKDTEPDESFETMLDKLQQVVRELESGRLSLDDSLLRYESGVGYLRRCYAKLDQVEGKLRQLVDVDDKGVAITQPFLHSATFMENQAGQDEDEDLD